MKQHWKPFAIYALLDIFCTGMGMGVPFMNIQLGFLVGWYLSRRALRKGDVSPSMLRTLLIHSLITVLPTFAMMVVIWCPWCKVLWDPTYDFKQTGIPLILYGAKSSFIGWMVLMVVISPFLQLLTTLSAAVVTLAVCGDSLSLGGRDKAAVSAIPREVGASQEQVKEWDFKPVRIKGEPLSATISADRR